MTKTMTKERTLISAPLLKPNEFLPSLDET